MTVTAERDEIGHQLIPITQVRESKTNPRRTVRDAQFADLVASVKQHGILQPILVRQIDTSPVPEYELVAGHRRLAAARDAGLEAIQAVVRELTDEQALEIQVIENLQRSDLHPLEEAEGYRQLMHVHKHDVARIAERVGRSAKYVYDRVKLLSLIKAAQKLFLDGRITAGHAVILARLKPKDQERAIDVSGHDSEFGGTRSPLFTDEYSLFRTDEERDQLLDAQEKDPYLGKKTRSVRELQAWVDEHVRFDAGAEDLPDLFPETHQALAGAKEGALKVVSITREYMIPEDARSSEKVLTERSWERADGREGSKPCEHSVLGVVVIGPGRGESFRVCTAKEKCKVHWAAWQRERAKRKKEVSAEGKTGEDRAAAERRRLEQQRAREELLAKIREKATPKILEAIAGKIRAAKAGSAGPLGTMLIKKSLDWGQKPSTLVPAGKTAEDLVRHLAMNKIAGETRGGWGWDRLMAHARSLGIDAKAITKPFEKEVQTSAEGGTQEKKAAKPPRGQRPRKRGKKK